MVAEVEEEGAGKLIGVGRLVLGADHESAEYAVAVGDAWQGRGIRTMLTERRLAIAAARDTKNVIVTHCRLVISSYRVSLPKIQNMSHFLLGNFL
jgi:GNAT superfamily N-acetyltransferase